VNLNYGCGPFYAEGWLNVDLHDEGDTHPDLVAGVGESGLRALDAYAPFARVYLGHVLEHVPWVDVPWLLAGLALRAPGGELCVVGPDSWSVLHAWKAGTVPTDLVAAVLEDHLGHQEAPVAVASDRHHWNCYEQRVVDLLRERPWAHDVTPTPLPDLAAAGWPLTSLSDHQFGVTARIA
jgi:hypothetical protein